MANPIPGVTIYDRTTGEPVTDPSPKMWTYARVAVVRNTDTLPQIEFPFKGRAYFFDKPKMWPA